VKDLTKKKIEQFSSALEAAQAAFGAEIDKLAEQARAEILPYFKEHGLDFVAGAGWGWSITRPAGSSRRHAEKFVQDDDLPQYIRELLNLEVAYNDQLGLHIRPINRGE
jgi:hypothetical protein